jgi:HNH endonuclease
VSGLDAFRPLVVVRAGGCCEYCLIHQSDAGLPHEVDHVISRKHGGETQAENLAFACYLCNRYKGSDIASLDPATQELVCLFHPRQDRWDEHFRIVGPILER